MEVAQVGRDKDAAGTHRRESSLPSERRTLFERVPARDRIQVERATSLSKLCVVVNAANESLLGGGRVDGAIHQAAGPALLEECKKLGGAKPGEVSSRGAHKLPARWWHAVGPAMAADVLVSCYRRPSSRAWSAAQ